jgi:hypothetical protein
VRYAYVGPADVLERSRGQARGCAIADAVALREYLGSGRGEQTFTYVVDLGGCLRLADRHAEHVACSGGQPVLAAGELRLQWSSDALVIASITNLSTGYCPEPASWPSVAAALARAGVAAPPTWTRAFEFRRCDACGQRNVIKDDWWVCDVCEAPLARRWNFAG